MTDDKKMTKEEGRTAFDIIATSPEPVAEVEFPKPHPVTGKYVKIGIRPLDHKEMKAMLAATALTVDAFVKAKKLSPDAPEVQTMRWNRSAVETLFRACRDPEDPTKGAFSTPEVLESLNDSALEVLFNSYRRVAYQLGEGIGEMQDKELDSWIDAIAEGGQADAINFFDRASPLAVIQLMSTMASRLAKLNQDIKRSTSLASESTPSESASQE